MARPRRLRHKLMLGLALVVGSVGLLLGGTLYGLTAYLRTVRVTERKLCELENISVVLVHLTGLQPAQFSDPATEYRELSGQVERATILSGVYRTELKLTQSLGLDPEGGEDETVLLDRFDAALGKLTAALKKVSGTRAGDEVLKSVREDPDVREAYDEANLLGQNIRHAIVGDIGRSIRESNSTIRRSLWVVGCSTLQMLIIVAALMVYFREWFYTPIRELQAGVQRVHAQDFAHPIVLHTRDELEELATEFNAMTARLGAVHRDLVQQVNDRSRQLVRSERMVSVGFLAAGVAHEINNPLASILFCSEALERRLADAVAHAPPADAEVLTRYLKMIQQEALRCKEITQKLLDFSRTGERKREATDIAGLVRGVLEVARHLPNCRGKAITFDPQGYVVAPVNAQDLKSVILNLVVNALDSMDETGSLAIHLGTADGAAVLSFADSGCGMTEETLQNIFEPFYTRSRTGKGTGLGLFISHQIVDQHGGQIQATSAGPGKGSTFTVRIPLADAGDMGTPGVPGESDPAAILPFPGKRAA
ncbi:MAG: HAMP domain-containing sensor histidine kinase [Gemmataceae bacterium]